LQSRPSEKDSVTVTRLAKGRKQNLVRTSKSP